MKPTPLKALSIFLDFEAFPTVTVGKKLGGVAITYRCRPNGAFYEVLFTRDEARKVARALQAHATAKGDLK